MAARSSSSRQWAPIALRIAVGGGCALAGLRLFLPPAPIGGAVTWLAWLGFALGIGYGFAHFWALLLTLLPFIGVWYTRATGPEYLGNGDASWLASTLLILMSAGAIGLDAGLHRWARDAIAWHRTATQSSAAIIILAPALSLLLVGAALDLAGGRAFLRPVRPVEVRRYGNDEVRASAAGLPFAIYGTTSEGVPGGILRQTIAPPGTTPTEVFIVIYCDTRCRRASEVQILSAPPGFHRARESQPITGTAKEGTPVKTVPPLPLETVEIAGVAWRVVASGPQAGRVSATADVNGASVQIGAPDRATFARIAVTLQPFAPALPAR